MFNFVLIIHWSLLGLPLSRKEFQEKIVELNQKKSFTKGCRKAALSPRPISFESKQLLRQKLRSEKAREKADLMAFEAEKMRKKRIELEIDVLELEAKRQKMLLTSDQTEEYFGKQQRDD